MLWGRLGLPTGTSLVPVGCDIVVVVGFVVLAVKTHSYPRKPGLIPIETFLSEKADSESREPQDQECQDDDQPNVFFFHDLPPISGVVFITLL
jgi:hypothetical protein